jgi:mannose-6-phosphate isomerase-like protein (cupin superfamily)
MSNISFTRRKLMHFLGAGTFGSIISPTSSQASSQLHDGGKPIYVSKENGEKIPIGGNTMTLKLSNAQTGGCLSFLENRLAPGFLGAPPHFHKTFDEICYVLEGTVHVLVGDEVFVLNAGDVHLRPRGSMHTFWNSGTQSARCLELSVPGVHEAYLKDISELLSRQGPPTSRDFAAFEKKYDIVYQMDKLPEIMQKYHVHL